MSPVGGDTADAFDGLGVAGDAAFGAPTGDDAADAAPGLDASTDVPVTVGTADALTDLPTAVTAGARTDFAAAVDAADALADEVEGVDVLDDAPPTVGAALGGAPTDAPARVGAATEGAPTDPPARLGGAGVVGAPTDAPTRVGAATVDAPKGVPTRPGGAGVDVPDVVPATVGPSADAPASVGMAFAYAPRDAPAAADPVPGDAPARTAPAGAAVEDFPAGEAPLAVTPMGLEIFLAAGPDGSEVDVLRGAAPAAPGTLEELAPIETPTGREGPTGVVPGGDGAIPCLGAATGALRLTAALAAVAAGAAVTGDVAVAGALPTARATLPPDLVMSAAGVASEGVAGALSSGAPNSTSGSSNSADDNNNVGITPESAGASGTDVLGAVGGVEVGEASVPEPSSTPYASKSSSGLVGPFDGVVEAVAVDGGGLAPPTCDAVPFNPKGSSTGRSARGSRAGREAASIVFEPESGDQSWTYPAVPVPRYLGAGSQIGGPTPGS